MKKVRTSKVVPKIRQLATMATELREGASFNITRLITLKSLCEEATAAARFAVHLAQLTYRRMQEKPCPSHLDPEKWAYYKQVVDEAIRQMARYMEKPTEEAADLVRAWLSDVRAVQNTYRNQAWGPVRIIHSTEVLMIEYALSCLLQPTASADWGYRLARQYAESIGKTNGLFHQPRAPAVCAPPVSCPLAAHPPAPPSTLPSVSAAGQPRQPQARAAGHNKRLAGEWESGRGE
jgi:hypothetical protein